MTVLDHYNADVIEVGVAELAYHLANPRLDSVIWLIQGDQSDVQA